MNALKVVIADFITRKLGGAGKVTQCELGQEDFQITLQLEGQPDPVSLNVKGITWSVQETMLILHCQSAHCSLPWLETLIQNWLRDHQQQVRWPDHIKFIPLKLKLRKAA